MPFPLAYLLVPFGAVLLIAGLYVFFNVFHVLKFGIEAGGTYIIALFYVGGFAALVLASFILFSRYDWKEQVNPVDLIPLNPAASSTYGL